MLLNSLVEVVISKSYEFCHMTNDWKLKLLLVSIADDQLLCHNLLWITGVVMSYVSI